MPVPFQLPDAYSRVNLNYVTFVSNKYRLIYVATAKAGCSTVKHTLMQAELERDDVRFPEMDDVHDRAIHPLSSPARQYDFAANLAEPLYLKFCFVRDPYARLLSLYLDKLVRRRDGYFRERMAEISGRPKDETPPFPAFVAAVAEIGPDLFDSHTERQTTRTMQGVIAYDVIGRFESFEADLRRILESRGIDFDRYYYAERRHASAANDRLAAMYDAQTAALTRAMYASDFERFGYDPAPAWLAG